MINRALQSVIDKTYARASPHSKKIFGKPMSSEDVAKIINLKEHMSFMATVNRDGKPHILWDLFAFWKDTLYTCSTPRSVSYWNLRRSGNVAILITGSEGDRAVFIEGEARQLGPATELKQLISHIEKGVPGFRMPDYDRSIFEIKPQRVFTYR